MTVLLIKRKSPAPPRSKSSLGPLLDFMVVKKLLWATAPPWAPLWLVPLRKIQILSGQVLVRVHVAEGYKQSVDYYWSDACHGESTAHWHELELED